MDRKKKPIMRRAGGALLTCALVGGGLFLVAPAASAATTDIVVTNLALSGAGSFRAALEQANASTNPDGVSISFAESLVGAGMLAVSGSSANSMSPDRVGHPSGDFAGTIGQNGARFVIDSAHPVSIDFTNLDGITDVDGSAAAAILVQSDDVKLAHLKGITAAEAAIAVGGSNTTLDDLKIEDAESNNTEVGVALLDGATGTSISDSTVYSPYFVGILVDTEATVSDTSITGLSSRGVQNWAHFDFGDDATVHGFSVADSTIGVPEETSPTRGFWIGQNTTVADLSVTGSTIQSPGQDAFYFEGSGQTVTNAIIDENTIGGTEARSIGSVISANTATWNGLSFSNNDVSYAGGIDNRGAVTDLTFDGNDISEAGATLFRGAVSNAEVNDNTFSTVNAGSAPVVGLLGEVNDATIDGNVWDFNTAIDNIRIGGAVANNVAFTNNTLTDIQAGVSVTSVKINGAGTGNVVSGNTLSQDNSREGARADSFNHWAIYSDADAPSAQESTGWSITGNSIDGFGWNYLAEGGAGAYGGSEAPILLNGVGQTLVTGNEFGVHNNSSAPDPAAENPDTRSEEDAHYYVWNVHDSVTNNTVQTYRPTNVVYTGENATFTATNPDPVIGNNPAVANAEGASGVTLHVYWTAAGQAEEYLGAVENVAVGARYSIPTEHTDGYIRVQTVDAAGNTSQYSIIDQTAASVVGAPTDIEVTDTEVTGTAGPGNIVTVRDDEDNVVDTVVVDEDGTWSLDGLQCDADYTVTQGTEIDHELVESEPVEFTTTACEPDDVPTPTSLVAGEDEASGEGDPDNTITLRDDEGNVVDTVVVGEDGTWRLDGLQCDADYTVTQGTEIDRELVESQPVEFTTLPCGDDDGGSDDGSTDGGNADDGSTDADDVDAPSDADGAGADDDTDASSDTDGTGGTDDNTVGDIDSGDADGSDDGSNTDAGDDGELAVTGAEGVGIAAGGALALLAIGGAILYVRRRAQRA